MKDGQKVQVERRTMPGYVLVNMDLNEDSWELVKNTPGVTGFVGAAEAGAAQPGRDRPPAQPRDRRAPAHARSSRSASPSRSSRARCPTSRARSRRSTRTPRSSRCSSRSSAGRRRSRSASTRSRRSRWPAPKESPDTHQAAGARRRRQPGAAGRPRAGPARREHHGVLQGVQRPDPGPERPIIPVEITVYEDRSFTFITKTPPAAVLIKEAIGLDKGSGEPNRNKVGAITMDQVRQIAETEAAGPERARRRPGREDHRRHRAHDGRGGERLMPKHGKRYRETCDEGRPRDAVPPPEAVAARQGASSRPSSTRPSRSTSAPASTSATPTSSCAARSRFPHGLGKDVTVAVFAKGDKAREAEEAGADLVGAEDLAKRIEDGWTDFDVAIATPDMMPVVGRLGRVLGPQGKMPNPKVGTVTMDLAKAVAESKAGQRRVPHRPHRDRPPADRQGLASTSGAARELRRADRRDRARQAGGGQGPLPAHDHAHHDDGPRHTRRPGVIAHRRRRPTREAAAAAVA